MFYIQNSQHTINLIIIFSVTFYFVCSNLISLASLITLNLHVGPDFYFMKVNTKITCCGVVSDRQSLVFISLTCSFTFTGHFAVQ